MNVKVRCALVSLALITFSIVPTHACVTTGDLSGGSWETSDATNPCMGALPLQGKANTPPRYVSVVQTEQPHFFALGHLPNQHGMSPFLFLPFLALRFALNQKGPVISASAELAEIQVVSEAGR